MPAELQEMISIQAAARMVDGLAWGVLLAVGLCLAIAAAWPAQRMWWLRAAATLAPWMVLLPVGWDVYLARVSYHPDTGFCGLHSVRTMAINAIAAVAVGVLYGLYLRWLWPAGDGGASGAAQSADDGQGESKDAGKQ